MGRGKGQRDNSFHLLHTDPSLLPSSCTKAGKTYRKGSNPLSKHDYITGTNIEDSKDTLDARAKNGHH